ncbi:hypothetical protein BBJ28_00010317 [Nothophytophthora sp. Chile5]|nr:hypothetical protein BBJ28_00010317 [Nothophytophthora sp. Chile5]
MVQRASQQYLECRRSVTAKVDEVKQLDEQIAAVFQQISALSEAAEDGAEPSEEAKAAAKSVGRLEVTLAGVEGEAPVANAAITVALDPEYEGDEYETVEEVVEKRDVVVTDEHGHVVEDGVLPEEDGEHTPRKLKTTTKITRTVIKKRVKKEKAPVVRTVAWEASTEGDEDAETSLSYPATFVFDPVQSREAIVTITVAAASTRTSTEDEEEEEEEEPVKEIEFSIASLFQGDALDRWYTIADEEEAEDVPTTITEVVEEAEDVPTTITEVVEEQTAAEETTTQEGEEAAVEETEESEKTEEVAEEPEETAEKAEEAAEETEEVAEETEEAAEEMEAKSEVEEAEKTEEAKPVVSRFHVKATFVLSEAEKLSISAVTLSKQKQETEAALQMLEREAASLRTKYERLNASQRQMNASSISKPKSSLLGGRFGAGAAPVPRKSQYQKLRESVSAVLTPPRQQLLISLAMFAGSVCLFHFNGDNLLA